MSRTTNLSKADLKGVNLSGANLSGAILRDCNLAGAILAGAILKNADLLGAKLDGVDLSGADCTGANIARSAENFSLKIQRSLESHFNWINSNGSSGQRADLQVEGPGSYRPQRRQSVRRQPEGYQARRRQCLRKR